MLASMDRLYDKYYLGVQVAGIGLGMVDYAADTIVLDARAAALFDLPEDAPVPRSMLHERIHPDDRPLIDEQIEVLLDPEAPGIIEVTHRVKHGNGAVKWVTARKQVEFERGSDGGPAVPVSGLVAIIDVSAHKEDQQKIQFLLDELKHRSKNMIAVVQSIARRTFATGTADDFTERFSDRLNGLACNDDALVQGNWRHADLGDLVKSHMRGFASEDNTRIAINGPMVKVNPDEAQAVGLAFHELATNASKYGALSDGRGRVAIAWQLMHAGRLRITWRESGGPKVKPPEQKGFGHRVMKDMAEASLNGTVDLQFHPEGVNWSLTFPLETKP